MLASSLLLLLSVETLLTAGDDDVSPASRIRIVPDGVVVEGVSSNVTLVCDVSGEYDSIVWFYNGDFLRQLPDPECDDDIEFSGDGSVNHELSSEGVDLLSEEGFSDFIEDRLSKRSADLEANIDEGSGDSSYDVIEELLSMSGDYLTDDSESLLCGVDPSMLTLQDVSRHFSGHYSCAGVRGDHTPGPVSQPLHLHVQCESHILCK